MIDTETPIYSINDVIEAYRNYDKTPEIEDILLYFISDMTGISIDELFRRVEEK